MKRIASVFQLIVFAPAAASLLMAGASSEVGTWKLNVGESTFSGGSAPKSATRIVEAQGDGVSVNCEIVESDGASVKYSYVAGFDEKDSAISGSGSHWREDTVANAETIGLRRVGSNAFAAVLKKSGNVVMTMRIVVSKGGKATTLTESGVDSKGQPTKSVTVWDRQ
jgi:hypothetical protein